MFQKKKSLRSRGPALAPSATQTSSFLWPLMATAKKNRFWWWPHLCFLLLKCFWTHGNLLHLYAWVFGTRSVLLYLRWESRDGWRVVINTGAYVQVICHLLPKAWIILDQCWTSESCHLQPLSTTPSVKQLTTCMFESSSLSSTYILTYVCCKNIGLFPCSSTRWNPGDRGSGASAQINPFCPVWPMEPQTANGIHWDSYLLTYWAPKSYSLLYKWLLDIQFIYGGFIYCSFVICNTCLSGSADLLTGSRGKMVSWFHLMGFPRWSF